MHEKLESSLARIITWGLIATTLLVTPLWAVDPINPIKMLAVVATGFVCVGLILSSRTSVSWSKYKVAFGLIAAFVFWQVVVLFASGGQIIQQLFGVNGRNTGFITYLAFSFIFIGSAIAAGADFLKRIIPAVYLVGAASLAYGVIQAIGGDPFKWVNLYSPVFGFLGNPNFQSSLLGMLGAMVFAQLFVKGLKLQFKGLIGLYLLVTLYVIKETASQQGFLVLVLGIGVVVGLYVIQMSKKLGMAYGLLSVLGFFAVLFGTLNKGPLASLLYKESVTYRGDYWSAGWTMTVDHPIFGVGIDSYGDWYRRGRTLAATVRRGPDVTANAAHNVYLDISSNGGFPLLGIYLALMVVVVISAIKVLRRSTGFDPAFAGLVAGWVAFQAQSIISINQIGLAIWGWVFSGLIIGYEINTRNAVVTPTVAKKGRVASKPAQASASSVVAVFVAFLLGVLVAMPPYLASAKYNSARESGSAEMVEDSAYLWPLDPVRMIQAAGLLYDSKLTTQALSVLVDATKEFPDYYGTWGTLYQLPEATPEQKAEALVQMKRLDPLNPNLK
jgi:O-antigen ligase